MVDVRRSAIVDAPIDEVWRMLRDFNGHERWHPAIAASRIEEGYAADRIGAVRDFRLAAGGRLREQLLALSDRDHSLTYCLLESPLPLMGYVATIRLRAVTDGNRTFWQWTSRFDPPPGQREYLARLVAEDIYEAGFRAIRALLRRGIARPPPPETSRAMPIPAGRSAGVIETQAMVVARHGGPEVLEASIVQVPPPGPGQVRIRHGAIGVNYIDVYCRTGYFDLLQPPGILGMEAAGVIESVGSSVHGWQAGDRVAYACPPVGAYAGLRVMAPDLLVALPPEIDDATAAASLLKGIAASFLLHEVYPLKLDDVVVVHAAAGGVGLLLVQWAKALGATVIGIVSTDEKARRARAAGCDHIVPSGHGFAGEVMRLTSGHGADAVFDAVGKDSFAGSLEALAIRGHLVSFGQASGTIGEWDIGSLAAKSATLSRPNYGHYADTPERLKVQTERLFGALRSGSVKVDPPTRYRLAEAALAHRDLEGRRTIGSIILIP